jgi:hypothetical protein
MRCRSTRRSFVGSVTAVLRGVDGCHGAAIARRRLVILCNDWSIPEIGAGYQDSA